ncbi:isochorismatase family protein [Endozoicomonas gorgoniicola]|uniref:Isochorismatase family protein n=1 Tax=Endozoicomonas gorgoniicola TaxID=1234144 RepID=A0ABT3MVT5_9GAMM|nr:isochorismatase family protein [Endozoicomonas gorgoniicola]MCW7553473.1 isochorismatase family protein [Endozoicomonas gorgoniicola]
MKLRVLTGLSLFLINTLATADSINFIQANASPNLALMVIDMQEDKQTKLPGTPLLHKRQRQAVEAAYASGITVVCVNMGVVYKGQKAAIPCPESIIPAKVKKSAQYHEHIKAIPVESINQDTYPKSAFEDGELHKKLQASGITRLILAGAYVEVCVDASLRSALGLGYKVLMEPGLVTGIRRKSQLLKDNNETQQNEYESLLFETVRKRTLSHYMSHNLSIICTPSRTTSYSKDFDPDDGSPSITNRGFTECLIL